MDLDALRALDGGWLELVLGRIVVGRWTTPWIANGALQLDGERHRLGGPNRTRATLVDEHPTGARFVVTGDDGLRLEGRSRRRPSASCAGATPTRTAPSTTAPTPRCATCAPRSAGAGRAAVEIDAPMAASYELGMRETDHGLTVQPYDDGRL